MPRAVSENLGARKSMASSLEEGGPKGRRDASPRQQARYRPEVNAPVPPGLRTSRPVAANGRPRRRGDDAGVCRRASRNAHRTGQRRPPISRESARGGSMTSVSSSVARCAGSGMWAAGALEEEGEAEGAAWSASSIQPAGTMQGREVATCRLRVRTVRLYCCEKEQGTHPCRAVEPRWCASTRQAPDELVREVVAVPALLTRCVSWEPMIPIIANARRTSRAGGTASRSTRGPCASPG